MKELILKCDECGCKDSSQGIGGWSVVERLWNEFGNGKGWLCIVCFESKLGRKLRAKDFTSTIDNESNKEVQDIFESEGYSKKAGWGSVGTFNSENGWIWKDIWHN